MYPKIDMTSVDTGVQPRVIVVLVVKILSKSFGFSGKGALANLDSRDYSDVPFEFVATKKNQ